MLLPKYLNKLLCKGNLLFLLAILSFTDAFGQFPIPECNIKEQIAKEPKYVLGTQYNGSNPFLGEMGKYNHWGKGEVYLTNGDTVINMFVVYNSLGSMLLYVDNYDKNNYYIDKTTVKGFSILEDEKKKHRTYYYSSVSSIYQVEGGGGFFETLVSDSISLYLLSTLELIPPGNDFKVHQNYFISTPEGLKRISLNRSSVCRALKHSKEFKKHLKHIGLRANTVEKMVKVIQEYNNFIKTYNGTTL